MQETDGMKVLKSTSSGEMYSILLKAMYEDCAKLGKLVKNYLSDGIQTSLTTTNRACITPWGYTNSARFGGLYSSGVICGLF